MTNKEAINILTNIIQLPVTRGSCKSQARYLVLEAIQKAVEALEVADAVRCKDCNWWTKQSDSLQGRCALLDMYPTGAWYCGNARKREEKTDE